MKILFAFFLILNSCNFTESSSDDNVVSSQSSSSQSGFSSENEDFAEECVAEINKYRVLENLPALDRWEESEGCSDLSAKGDSETGKAHDNFGKCGEMAQNECPSWKTVESVLNGCLAMMWDERKLPESAPFSERGHYLNMSSTKYTKVGCGFYKTDDGEVWAVQNFN
ncbi:CAP domain-containing protein [Fibrobacterales bacterium]|nr:CAP domain-containing protein [Fibrobacterales bacterium]